MHDLVGEQPAQRDLGLAVRPRRTARPCAGGSGRRACARAAWWRRRSGRCRRAHARSRTRRPAGRRGPAARSGNGLGEDERAVGVEEVDVELVGEVGQLAARVRRVEAAAAGRARRRRAPGVPPARSAMPGALVHGIHQHLRGAAGRAAAAPRGPRSPRGRRRWRPRGRTSPRTSCSRAAVLAEQVRQDDVDEASRRPPRPHREAGPRPRPCRGRRRCRARLHRVGEDDARRRVGSTVDELPGERDVARLHAVVALRRG